MGNCTKNSVSNLIALEFKTRSLWERGKISQMQCYLHRCQTIYIDCDGTGFEVQEISSPASEEEYALYLADAQQSIASIRLDEVNGARLRFGTISF